MKSINVVLLLSIMIFSSCSKNNPDPISSGGIYEDGYFIINEGNFNSGNGSISYINENGIVENDVFATNNSSFLGDVVQSMNIIGDNAYIVVNNSGKIEVASKDSMKYITTINASSPRYIEKVSQNKAYVTDWGINGVQVIDLENNIVTSTINCGTGPEGITYSNGYAYVCNVGGWGLDNTVSIINTETDIVEYILTVGDKPNSVVVDINGAIWVLSGGYTEWNSDWTQIISQTPGNLVKIVDNVIESSFTFDVGNSPRNLKINEAKTDLYFSNGSVYRMNIYDTQLPTNILIERSFYGIGVNNDYIYGSDPVDYVQSGWSYKYNLNGNVVDSFQVGIIPNGYCFN